MFTFPAGVPEAASLTFITSQHSTTAITSTSATFTSDIGSIAADRVVLVAVMSKFRESMSVSINFNGGTIAGVSATVIAEAKGLGLYLALFGRHVPDAITSTSIRLNYSNNVESNALAVYNLTGTYGKEETARESPVGIGAKTVIATITASQIGSRLIFGAVKGAGSVAAGACLSSQDVNTGITDITDATQMIYHSYHMNEVGPGPYSCTLSATVTSSTTNYAAALAIHWDRFR